MDNGQQGDKSRWAGLWVWVPTWLRNFLIQSLGTFVAVGLGGLGALWIFSLLITKWLDERDARLIDLKEVVADYRTDIASGFDEVKLDIRRSADASERISQDISDIRERLARVEIQTENASNILMSNPQPIIEREFAPILVRPTPAGIGGPDFQPIEGFDQMVMTIPYPRNVQDRDAAITNLINKHRQYALSVSHPKFDPDKNNFEVTQRQILSTDGSIRLELTSTVVE